MKFLENNPLIKIFPFWISGLITGLVTEWNKTPFLYINLFFVLFFLILLIFNSSFSISLKKKINLIIPPWIFFVALYYGILHRPQLPSSNFNKKIVYSGIVVESPKEKKNTYQCIVETDIADTSENAQFIKIKKFRILLYIKKDTIHKPFYGDRIIFSVTPQLIKNRGNPFEFDVEKYWKQKNVFYSAYSSNYEILSHNNANPFIYKALKIRENLLRLYRDYDFSNDEFAVLSALTLGYKDEINYELRKKFANTGAMHILAVSGLHVGIIYMILEFLLSFSDKKKKLNWIKPSVTILFLWIFAFITGLSPSVMRASLMFSLFSFGKIISRKYFVYNAMIASAMILLFINPLQIFSVGFQLSYAAVFAIVTFQPGIYNLIKTKNKIIDSIWSLTAVTLAAQIGTLPLGLYYFHQFPNLFFLTNLAVIPLASIILYGAVALLALAFIKPLGMLIAWILKYALRLLIFSVDFIDSFPYSVSENIIISPLQAILLYIVLFVLSIFIIKKKSKFFLAFLAIFPIFILSFNFEKKTTQKILIFNIPKTSLITVIDGKNSVIITDKSLLNDNSFFERYLALLLAHQKTKNINFFDYAEKYPDGVKMKNFFIKRNFMQIFNKKFFIINDSHITRNSAKNKIKVDYVILRNNVYLQINEIANLVDYDTIIFDSSNKLKVIKRWKEQCAEDSIAWYSVPEQGCKVIFPE